jgi:hypothetical protein
MTQHETDFADDLLRGASEISEFLFKSPAFRRKVYHLVATSNLPVFKIGAMICARKSVLLKWIEDQEQRRAGKASPKPANWKLETVNG